MFVRHIVAGTREVGTQMSKVALLVGGLQSCGGVGLGPSATTETGHFSSGDIRLAYTFDIPETGAPPYGLVVLGHDSGPNTRKDLTGFAQRFVDHGLAVFRFDKRGTGDSEGVYERGRADFNLLSGDLVAAIELIRDDPRIDINQIGLMGNSQAGWILPIVATMSDDVAFTILLSGPTVTVAQHNFWDATADDESLSIDQLEAMLADFTPGTGDFDPRPLLESMTMPGIWIYGDQDRIIPARSSAAVLDEIVMERSRPFTIVNYPTGDHGLRDVDTGEGLPWHEDVYAWFDANFR